MKKLIALTLMAALLIITGVGCPGGATTKSSATPAADKDKDKAK